MAVTELVREPATGSLVLSGLDKRDVARFIELTSGEEPSEGFVATIDDETEADLLFVGEIVRLLATEKQLGPAEGRRLAIPQSVRDVIARRLRHLSLECNRVLVLAAVLGREFGLDALAHMAGVPGMQCSTLWTRPWQRASSLMLPAVRDSCASRTFSSGTRSMRGSRPRAACGCTGWSSPPGSALRLRAGQRLA